MKKTLLLMPFIALTQLAATTFAPFQTDDEVKKVVSFLTASGNLDETDGIGVTYVGTTEQLNGIRLPLSYYSTIDYWGAYIPSTVQNPQGDPLDVVDMYNTENYTLTPENPTSTGAQLQVERLNVFNGADIYDAACWQIALALAAQAGVPNPDRNQSLFDLANNQNLLLKLGYDGNQTPPPTSGANRATTASGQFDYYGHSLTEPEKAYFFRMVTQNWLSTDPFLDTIYMSHVTADNLPQGNPAYKAGLVTWMDWKPITGENSWAFFVGPMHMEMLKQKAYGMSYVPFSSVAVQNALNLLEAYTYMQSPSTRAIWYAVKGSLGNTGSQTVDYQVSTENNASTLGGLLAFQKVLEDELQNETYLTSAQQAQINQALQTIETLIYGSDGKSGILGYMQNHAWDATNGIFYQGGFADDPNKSSTWVPTIEPKAVDVNTWGVSVLGQPLVDKWFGFGTAYKIWQNVKSWGGFYGPDKKIWGVGYSDKDNNGEHGNYEDGIISAEWTAGAINMVRVLITQYTQAETSSEYTPTQQADAKGYVAALQADHDSMVTALLTLRNDSYAATAAYEHSRPTGYDSLIPISPDKLAFIYASKRYFIPFGWYSNPLPSTTSTSWSLMLHYNYNPFHPDGTYEAYSWNVK